MNRLAPAIALTALAVIAPHARVRPASTFVVTQTGLPKTRDGGLDARGIVQLSARNARRKRRR